MELAMPAEEAKRCYHCGFESTSCKLKYYDNKKRDQPRYECPSCKKLFTLGFHGRAQGKTYNKKRGEDPEEVRDLERQCPHCGVANHAAFKYYNNGSKSQPRFKCLSCGKPFQMRLVIEGQEKHLVFTSSKQRCGSNVKEAGQFAPSNANNNSLPYNGMDPFGATISNSIPCHEVEPMSTLGDEDVNFANLIETNLMDKVGPTSILSDEDANLLTTIETNLMDEDGPTFTLSDEDANLLTLIESNLMDELVVNNVGNVDMVSSNANDGASLMECDNVMGQAIISMEELEAQSNQRWIGDLESSPQACDTYNYLPCNSDMQIVPPVVGNFYGVNLGIEDSLDFPIVQESGFLFQQALDEALDDWNEDIDMETL